MTYVLDSYSLKITPNPFTDRITVQSGFMKESRLILYDIYGKEVFSDILVGAESTFYVNVPSGIYLLHVVSEGKLLYFRKIVKI